MDDMDIVPASCMEEEMCGWMMASENKYVYKFIKFKHINSITRSFICVHTRFNIYLEVCMFPSAGDDGGQRGDGCFWKRPIRPAQSPCHSDGDSTEWNVK